MGPQIINDSFCAFWQLCTRYEPAQCLQRLFHEYMTPFSMCRNSKSFMCIGYWKCKPSRVHCAQGSHMSNKATCRQAYIVKHFAISRRTIRIFDISHVVIGGGVREPFSHPTQARAFAFSCSICGWFYYLLDSALYEVQRSKATSTGGCTNIPSIISLRLT